MRIVYGLGVLLEAIQIAHCAICSFKKHDRLGKSVCIYETLTFACAIVFFVFTFVPGHTVTVLAKGLTMALFDWMLIALMFYTQYYTGAVKTFKGVQAASMIFAVLDTYMLIENTWTNKIFDIESIKAENIKVVFNNDSLWYRLPWSRSRKIPASKRKSGLCQRKKARSCLGWRAARQQSLI